MHAPLPGDAQALDACASSTAITVLLQGFKDWLKVEAVASEIRPCFDRLVREERLGQREGGRSGTMGSGQHACLGMPLGPPWVPVRAPSRCRGRCH